jgi:hypothetical protein
MKKFKFLGIAVGVLLFVLTAGCDNGPQELIHTYEALPGPSGLEAKIYDGMIILQWNHVPAATSYRVVRKDTSTKLSVVRATVSNTTNNAIYYMDTVGWDNQLINDRDYEYSVTSVTANTAIVLSGGESKVTAKARIPSDFTPSLDADQITVKQYKTTNGTDQIIVSFPNQPNYRYQVAYTYGADQTIVREFETWNANALTTGINWYEPVQTATFPTIGGTNSVSVKAWFSGSESYYSNSAEVTKTDVTFAITPTLNSVTGFSATWVASGGVRLIWNNVADATGYKIYRAPVSRYITSMVTTGNVTVSGDWTVIDAAQERTNNGWVAFDPTTDNTGHYLYAIIAEGDGGAKSTPAYAGPNAYTITGYNLQASVPDAANAPRTVQLTWTANADTTYELHYAEVQNTTDPTQNAAANNYRVIGDFQAINVAPTALPAVRPAQAVVTRDFTGEDGKNYIFRLTATRNGVSETFPSILNTGAFSKTVQFQLSATYDGTDVVTLSINDNNTYRGRDYSIQVYRRIATTGSETAYQPLGVATSYDSTATASSWTYEDDTVPENDPPINLQYQYKIVVNGFANTGTGEATVNVNK